MEQFLHMSDVLCSGTESRLTDCPHNPEGDETTQEFATQMCSYSFDSDCNFYLLYTFSRLLSSTSIVLFYTSTAAAITKTGTDFCTIIIMSYLSVQINVEQEKSDW